MASIVGMWTYDHVIGVVRDVLERGITATSTYSALAVPGVVRRHLEEVSRERGIQEMNAEAVNFPTDASGGRRLSRSWTLPSRGRRSTIRIAASRDLDSIATDAENLTVGIVSSTARIYRLAPDTIAVNRRHCLTSARQAGWFGSRSVSIPVIAVARNASMRSRLGTTNVLRTCARLMSTSAVPETGPHQQVGRGASRRAGGAARVLLVVWWCSFHSQ